jgi:hypothetical protein
MKEELYKEVGINYRFFLGWRHAALAGYFIVFGAVLSLCISAFKDARPIVWLIPLCASPIGVCLWAVDKRTRSLYHAAMRAGKDLEAPEKGFYSLLSDEVALPPGVSAFTKVTQTAALNIVFIGGSLALLVISIILFIYSRA